MRTLLILLIVFFFAGLSAQAQTRDEYGLQTGRSNMEKFVFIYPNPAIDYVSVRFAHFPAQNVQVSLFNIIGNEVAVEIEAVDEREIRLRVKELAPGYYLIVFKDQQDKFQGTYKILKR